MKPKPASHRSAPVVAIFAITAALMLAPGCSGSGSEATAKTRSAAAAERSGAVVSDGESGTAVGLSGGESAEDSGRVPEAFSVRDRIPIKVLYFDTETEDNTRWLSVAVAHFERTHPTVKVLLSPVYGNETDYANRLQLSLKSDPSIDVILFDGARLRSFIHSGYLVGFMADTWPDWISRFPGKTKETVGYNGLDWAMPVSLEVQGLFYNANAFRRAGIPVPWHPDSWEDVAKAARALKGITEYPLWVPGSSAQSESTTLQTFGTLLSGTGDWMYENGKWITASQGMLDSLRFLYGLYQTDSIEDNLARSVMLSRHTIDTLARKLNAGEIGMLLHSCRLGPAIQRTTGDYEKTILVTPMPRKNGGPTSVTGSWMLGISNLSANKFISFEFLKSALSPEVQTVSCTLRGDIPVRRDVEAAESWRTDNFYASSMSDYLYFSRFRPEGAEYPQLSHLISIAVESVITGTRTPETAMAEFAKAASLIIGESRREEKPYR